MRFLSLLLAAVLAVMTTLGCNGTFKVTFPAAGQTSSQDFSVPGDKLEIRVRFSESVDFSSLVARQNVILETELDSNADITISSVNSSEIRITSVLDAGDLLEFDADGFFSLRLVGDGASPVQSAGGEALDGDANGSAGGVYTTQFVLIG